jgi:hypothetical protein
MYWVYRLWMGIIVLFLFSLFQSCSELKSSLWGVTATATVLSVQPSQYEPDDLYLSLRFIDQDGKQQFFKRTVGPRIGPVAPQEEVEIIYFSGAPDSARLVAERTFVWPEIFLAMIGVVVVWAFVTYRRMEAGGL